MISLIDQFELVHTQNLVAIQIQKVFVKMKSLHVNINGNELGE